MNRRILWIVLDSVGAGALPDAAAYGDVGANTLGHIQEKRGLRIPNMRTLGLGSLPGLGIPPVAHPAAPTGARASAPRARIRRPGTGRWPASR